MLEAVLKYTEPVRIPRESGAVTYKKIKQTTYVYIGQGRTYDKEKKYSVPKRTCIGKLNAEGAEIPNEKFFTMFPHLKPAKRRCPTLSVGSYAAFSKIVSSYGLKEMLDFSVGPEYSGLFLDLALYHIVNEDSAAQHFPAYAATHPLFSGGMHIYSDSTVSKALGKFGERGVALTFLDKWNERKDKSERIWVSYDSTNKNSAGTGLGLMEYGKAKDDNGCPTFNWSVAFDLMCRTRSPSSMKSTLALW